jgi:hypothetical protein
MAVRCAVLCAAALILAGFARVAMAAETPTDVAAVRCGKWAVAAPCPLTTRQDAWARSPVSAQALRTRSACTLWLRFGCHRRRAGGPNGAGRSASGSSIRAMRYAPWSAAASLTAPTKYASSAGRSGRLRRMLNPIRELRVEGDTPSLTRLIGPGCYAYQVDGRTFSYLVIFEARVNTATSP